MSTGKKAEKIEKTDAEWQEQLTPQQYMVTRLHGTEPAFSHPYAKDRREGIYCCICCGEDLFSSEAKYDSGTGWPSFYAPVSQGAVSEHEDNSLFSKRTEVRCSACDSHLGHVFPDGPEPTGLRYCMNGVSLSMKTAASEEEE